MTRIHEIQSTRIVPCLELEDLVLAVAKLGQDTSQLALVLGADLGATDGLVQTGRAAHEELDVLLLGLGQNGLQQLLGDVALAAGPLLGRVVKDVEGAEALRVGVLQVLQLLLQQNVVLVDVTEDQGNLGAVLGVLEDVARQLVHRSDTGTTSNQTHVVVLVSLPRVLDNRTLERKTLVDVQRVDVLGHRTVGVGLDDQLEEARDL